MNTYLMRLNAFRKDMFTKDFFFALYFGVSFGFPLFCLMLSGWESLFFEKSTSSFAQMWFSYFYRYWHQVLTMSSLSFLFFWGISGIIVASTLSLFIESIWESLKNKESSSSFQERWCAFFKCHWKDELSQDLKNFLLTFIFAIPLSCLILAGSEALFLKDLGHPLKDLWILKQIKEIPLLSCVMLFLIPSLILVRGDRRKEGCLKIIALFGLYGALIGVSVNSLADQAKATPISCSGVPR